MGFFDKVGSFLKREAKDLGDAAEGVKDKFDQELTKREQELELTPSEKIAALQQQASATDARFDAIANKATGREALADAVAEVGELPVDASLPNVTHIVLSDGRVRSGNEPAQVVDAQGDVHDVPVVEAPTVEELPARPVAESAGAADPFPVPAPVPPVAAPAPVVDDFPAPPVAAPTPVVDDFPAPPVAAPAPVVDDFPAPPVAAPTPVVDDFPAPPVAAPTPVVDDFPAPPVAAPTPVVDDFPAPPVAAPTPVVEDVPTPAPTSSPAIDAAALLEDLRSELDSAIPTPADTASVLDESPPADTPEVPAAEPADDEPRISVVEPTSPDYGKTPAQLKYERARAAANNLLDELRGELQDEGEI